MDTRRRRGWAGPLLYWLTVSLLVVVGTAGGFSVGLPLLLIGVTLAVLWPVRRRATRFWPVLAGEVGLVAGFVLVVPWSCTTSASSAHPLAHTTCSNMIGLEYAGSGTYNPSYLPSLLSALVAGTAMALGAWLLLRRHYPRR